ncbi:MAG TPA: type I-U CRISPR-associated RAMP protein Csb1/Cas7u [Candidatus Tumulicola sp.]|nr:type I-U CRISPR-associated RAMP protein Csb1/Cas7u [Candidatus Tumulicola sp.]
MTATLDQFATIPRILIEVPLRPVQGSRFQPTGFPNLGAAEFRTPDGATSILVESAQSMANRLENTIWDPVAGDLLGAFQGLPYVTARVGDRETDSIREAHRLNSPYLFPGISERLQEKAGVVASSKKKAGAGEAGESSGVDIMKLARAIFYFDPNSVLHGIFLEKLVGTARLTRVLSAFIEASDANAAESGGVKNDRVDPVGAKFGGAVKGFGNVPFTRTEYTAKRIVAYFSLDCGLLRSYGLGREAEDLLVAIGLWKIRKFLEVGGRLRTACDLEPLHEGEALKATRPAGCDVPSAVDLERIIRESIEGCKAGGMFAEPPRTEVVFSLA